MTDLAARRPRRFRLVGSTPPKDGGTDPHELASGGHRTVIGRPSPGHSSSDSGDIPFPLSKADVPLPFDEDPLQDHIAVPHESAMEGPLPDCRTEGHRPQYFTTASRL